VATENDACNGVSMLLGHLLTGTAQIFSDVRTYWSPAAIERVTGWKPTGGAAGGLIHLINSGAATLDGIGKQQKNGKPAMKPFWEITAKEAGACLDSVSWRYGNLGYFRGGGYSSDFITEGDMPVTMTRLNIV
jgi:L-fucose isomerase